MSENWRRYHPRDPIPLWDRVWAKVSIPDGDGAESACWPWVGALSLKKSNTRRGVIQLAGRGSRILLAHRVVLCFMGDGLDEYDRTFADGTPRHACHRCHNRLCCNPTHLFWGTPADNIREEHACRKRRRAVSTSAF